MGMEITWRARSASDKSNDWPYWYVTNDRPYNYNCTAEAFKLLTGEDWCFGHQFLPREFAIDLAARLNARQKDAVMGMDLLAIEQAAFEIGWKGALKAVHVQAAAKDILSAELLALLADLAAIPPQIDEVDNAN